VAVTFRVSTKCITEGEERTVTAVLGTGGANVEIRHASGVEIIHGQARNASVRGRSSAKASRKYVHAIAKRSEAEVSEPMRTDNVVKPGREPLVPGPGSSSEVPHGRIRRHCFAAGDIAKQPRPRPCELLEAVAPKNVHLRTERAVHSHVEA